MIDMAYDILICNICSEPATHWFVAVGHDRKEKPYFAKCEYHAITVRGLRDFRESTLEEAVLTEVHES